MIKKDFKTSYQTIKDIITAVFFFVVLWIIAGSYFDSFMRFLPGLTTINTSLEIVAFTLIFFATIWIIYGICGVVVDIIYRAMKDSNWYNSLTEYTLRIPVSKGQYEKIKNNKLFFSNAEFKDLKPYFHGEKFREWVEKIIDDEIRRLKNGKK